MQTYVTLNDGTNIPQFGLGVYMVPEGEQTYNAVLTSRYVISLQGIMQVRERKMQVSC